MTEQEWDKVDIKAAREAADATLEKRHCNTDLVDAYLFLQTFIDQVELIRNKQIKNIPALLRKPE